MKVILALTILAIAVSAFHSSPAPSTNPLPDDFTANFTLLDGGLNYTGYMVWDLTGRRSYTRIPALNQTMYRFQSFSQPELYTYTLLTSGCTCTVTKAGFITSYFASYMSATKTGSCPGGDLYQNNKVNALPGVPESDYCVNGNKPIYVQHNNARRTTFTTFTPGKPDFPFTDLEEQVSQCADACI